MNGSKNALISRLDRHFAGASALAAAAGFAGTAPIANAGIVYSGPVSINIPNTTAGVYLNLVTNVNNVSPGLVPGWDVNPYSSGAITFFNPAAPAGGVYSGGGAAAGTANLPAGYMIDATNVWTSGGFATTAGWTANLNSSDNIVGIRLQNEADGNLVHYGWMRITLGATTTAQPRTIVEYAYEDTAGVGILAGATSSGPTGACCVPSSLTCAVVGSTTCTTTLGGVYNGDGSTCAAANCPSPGACCKSDGTCAQTTAAACTSANGAYNGDSSSCATANCPPAGACCLPLGTCSAITAAACTSFGGVFGGGGTTCAGANCPGGVTMNCNIPGTFTDISATGTAITTGDDSSVGFTSSVTNALITNPNLFACTNGMITDSAFASFGNTTLPVAGLNLGLFPNWDDLYIDTALTPPGSLVHQAAVEGGVNVEIIQWNLARTFTAQTPVVQGTFEVKIFAPGGPALVQYIYQNMAWDWNGNSSTVGVQYAGTYFYQSSYGTSNTPGGPIVDNSVCSVVALSAPSACYANCDLSTTQPCLNVLDFSCFLNAFAAGNTYANCDNSTTPPVLNVLDFSCFLNSFAAGCSAC